MEKKEKKTVTKTSGADSRPTVASPYLIQTLVLSSLRCSAG